MKKIIFIIALVLGVSLTMVVIGYVLASQIEYVDLLGKRVIHSQEKEALLVIDNEEKVFFEYTIEDWQRQASNGWDNLFGRDLTPDIFTRFTAVSPFPGDVRTIIFSTSTYGGDEDLSLFWTLNINTRQLRFFGEKNKGVVGNIRWSPEETHFAYYLNTKNAMGDYLTVDNVKKGKKEFILSREDILNYLEEDDQEFNPEFSNLDWKEDSRIFFRTNSMQEGVFNQWSITKEGDDLKRE